MRNFQGMVLYAKNKHVERFSICISVPLIHMCICLRFRRKKPYVNLFQGAFADITALHLFRLALQDQKRPCCTA